MSGPANEAVYGAAVHAAGHGHQWQTALLLQREARGESCRTASASEQLWRFRLR